MSDENLKQWIMKQRLQNYGYDYKHFKKMSNLKSQLKTKLKYMPESEIRKHLAKEGILGKGRRLSKTPSYVKKDGKWVKSGKRRWDYTVGQSFNEELLNIMQIPASEGKKSFWEVQDKWW